MWQGDQFALSSVESKASQCRDATATGGNGEEKILCGSGFTSYRPALWRIVCRLSANKSGPARVEQRRYSQ